ncbi:MAG: ECF transporter S component [Bacilli bacterium]
MKTNDLTLSAILIAVGIILPMLTHFIAAGNIILPMHIPILVAGLTLRPKYAIIVGGLTPILSSALTGMPVVFPMLPIMFFELIAYAVTASILKTRTKINIYFILLVSLIVGRVVAAIVVQTLIIGFDANFPSTLLYIKGAISIGIPGLIIQFLFVPPLTIAIEKFLKKRY